jgi:hypothetical protein
LFAFARRSEVRATIRHFAEPLKWSDVAGLDTRLPRSMDSRLGDFTGEVSLAHRINWIWVVIQRWEQIAHLSIKGFIPTPPKS